MHKPLWDLLLTRFCTEFRPKMGVFIRTYQPHFLLQYCYEPATNIVQEALQGNTARY